jgi:hypothetical protein
MPDYGFGPIGPRASRVRPAAPPDAYGQQTWFIDASAIGKRDGTVIQAEFLNRLIGERLELARASGVAPPGNGRADAWLSQAILALIRESGRQQMSGQDIINAIDGVIGDRWKSDSISASTIINLLDGALGGPAWRNTPGASSFVTMSQGTIA